MDRKLLAREDVWKTFKFLAHLPGTENPFQPCVQFVNKCKSLSFFVQKMICNFMPETMCLFRLFFMLIFSPKQKKGLE